jgi:glycogen operon protein
MWGSFTPRGWAGGPILSFRGWISKRLVFEDGSHGPYYGRYVNVAGCGNSVNVDHPSSCDGMDSCVLLTDCRRWFRFDLPVTLASEGNGTIHAAVS